MLARTARTAYVALIAFGAVVAAETSAVLYLALVTP